MNGQRKRRHHYVEHHRVAQGPLALGTRPLHENQAEAKEDDQAEHQHAFNHCTLLGVAPRALRPGGWPAVTLRLARRRRGQAPRAARGQGPWAARPSPRERGTR